MRSSLETLHESAESHPFAVAPISINDVPPTEAVGIGASLLDNSPSRSSPLTTGDPDAACAGKSSSGGVAAERTNSREQPCEPRVESWELRPSPLDSVSACVSPSAVSSAAVGDRASSLSGALEQERPGIISSSRGSKSVRQSDRPGDGPFNAACPLGAIRFIGPRDSISSAAATAFPLPVAAASVRRSKYANTSLILAASGIQFSSHINAVLSEGFSMRSVYEEKLSVASENARRIRQGADVFVRPIFADVAKLLWPHKTAAQLASIAKRDERTAARWLSGEFEPPISIVLAVNQKIFGKGA